MNSELVGLAEISARAGVTKQAVANWRKRHDDFPPAIQELQSGPVWNWESVKEWLDQRRNRKTTVLSFINLKGGVGKTTTAVAVAEILAQEHNKHVLFIDLDPQTNGTVVLINEERWKEADENRQTIADLFEDALRGDEPPKFDPEAAIISGVSTINGGIRRLSVLPSSIRLINVQDKLAMIPILTEYRVSPIDLMRNRLAVGQSPVLDGYDYVIIDCPPSLGVITKNGLRISNGYVIPTIPDILSTVGIFQIVENIARFADDVGRPIPPLGIVPTKVGPGGLHPRIMAQFREGRLFPKEHREKQPPCFEAEIKQRTRNAEAADTSADLRTFRGKYVDNYAQYQKLTKEIISRCQTPAT